MTPLYYDPLSSNPKTLIYLSEIERSFRFYFNPNRLLKNALLLNAEVNNELALMVRVLEARPTQKLLALHQHFQSEQAQNLLNGMEVYVDGLDPEMALEGFDLETLQSATATLYEGIQCVIHALHFILKKQDINLLPYTQQDNMCADHIKRWNRNSIQRYCLSIARSIGNGVRAVAKPVLVNH